MSKLFVTPKGHWLHSAEPKHQAGEPVLCCHFVSKAPLPQGMAGMPQSPLPQCTLIWTRRGPHSKRREERKSTYSLLGVCALCVCFMFLREDHDEQQFGDELQLSALHDRLQLRSSYLDRTTLNTVWI